MNTNDNNGLRPNKEYLREAKKSEAGFYPSDNTSKAYFEHETDRIASKALDLLREDMKEKMIDFHIAAMNDIYRLFKSEGRKK